MKTFLNLAKKAFKQGSDIYGEKIIGYVSSKLEQDFFKKNHYTITLKLMQSNGQKCSAGVGFDLISQRKGQSDKSFCQQYKCEPSPYGYYLSVISGHRVFTVPVTEEMLDEFPMGLNKKPLDTYSIEELESRVLELKKQEFNSAVYKANRDIFKLRHSLGLKDILVNVSDLEYRIKTEEDNTNKLSNELPF